MTIGINHLCSIVGLDFLKTETNTPLIKKLQSIESSLTHIHKIIQHRDNEAEVISFFFFEAPEIDRLTWTSYQKKTREK